MIVQRLIKLRKTPTMSQIFEEASTFLRKKVTEFNDVKDLTNWAGSNNLLNDSIVKTRINELSKIMHSL